VHAGFVAGYAESIQTVFLVAVPIAALAFLATWLIPQVELQQWDGAEPGVPEAERPAVGAAVAPQALPGGMEASQPVPPPPVIHEALDPQDASSTDARPVIDWPGPTPEPGT